MRIRAGANSPALFALFQGLMYNENQVKDIHLSFQNPFLFIHLKQAVILFVPIFEIEYENRFENTLIIDYKYFKAYEPTDHVINSLIFPQILIQKEGKNLFPVQRSFF